VGQLPRLRRPSATRFPIRSVGVMKKFGLKICLFLFLEALLLGRTDELGTITGFIFGMP